MTKHTPGPWTIDTISGWTDGSDRDINGDIYIRGGDDALPFGQVFTDTEERPMLDPEIVPERIANARLMAAAPELLEALESITASYDRLLEEYGKPFEWGEFESDVAREAISKAKGGK